MELSNGRVCPTAGALAGGIKVLRIWQLPLKTFISSTSLAAIIHSTASGPHVGSTTLEHARHRKQAVKRHTELY